jgi:hypothetical protein
MSTVRVPGGSFTILVVSLAAGWPLLTEPLRGNDHSGVTLSGTVADSDGKPVAGATIVVAEGSPALRFITPARKLHDSITGNISGTGGTGVIKR